MAFNFMERLEARKLLAVSPPAMPEDLTVLGDTLYYTHVDAARGRELWKVGPDGAAVVVKDVRPGPQSAIPVSYGGGTGRLTALNGLLYFVANDGVNGLEVWKTDGTEAGTSMVTDVRPAAVGPPPPMNQDFTDGSVGALTPAGEKLFFSAATLPSGHHEVWATDGTAAGTHVVNIPGDAAQPLDPYYLVSRTFAAAGDYVYVLGRDGNLWRTDGTPENTAAVGPVLRTQFIEDVDPTAVGGAVFFAAYGPTGGSDLWKADAAGGGATLFKSFADGVSIHRVTQLTAAGPYLYFTTGGGTSFFNTELWRTDGTEAGTVPLATAARGSFGHLGPGAFGFFNLTAVGDALYWMEVENEYSGGTLEDKVVRLWRSDGTAQGTAVVRQLIPPTSDPKAMHLTAAGSGLYFTAFDPRHGNELWRSDGTAGGTVRVYDYTPEATGLGVLPPSTSPSQLRGAADGAVYFRTGAGRVQRWVWGGNNWPQADAGGPYELDRGAPLRLAAAGALDPDGDALSFSWDLDGDGVFGDATGNPAELSWPAAQALGLTEPREVLARVRVDDGRGHATDSPPVALSVGDFAPLALFSGAPQSGAERMTFTVTYVDGAGVDVASLVNNPAAIAIEGPNGFRPPVEFVSIDDATTNGSPRTVTYRFRAPGGEWDGDANGQYVVRHGDAPVQDVQGHRRSFFTEIARFDVNFRTGLPDVVTNVVSFTPQRLVGGGRGRAVVGVRNAGDVTATGSFGVSVYLVDALGRVRDLSANAMTNLRLNPGQGRKFNFRFVVPPALADGTYTVRAEAYGGGSAEPDWDNNVSDGPAVEVRQPRLDPALAPDALVVPPLRAGAKVGAAVALVNRGDPLPRVPLIVQAWLSKVAPIMSPGFGFPGPATPIGDVRPKVNLKAGITRRVKLRLVVPPNLEPGTYYFTVVFSPHSAGMAWTDADAANNFVVMQVTVA